MFAISKAILLFHRRFLTLISGLINIPPDVGGRTLSIFFVCAILGAWANSVKREKGYVMTISVPRWDEQYEALENFVL